MISKKKRDDTFAYIKLTDISPDSSFMYEFIFGSFVPNYGLCYKESD